jgi:hypothetical protein
MHTLTRLTALIIMLALPACVHVKATETETANNPAPSLPHWFRAELYFGLSRPGGVIISDTDFQHFADTVIAPQFPNGFTILSATGYWRESDHPKSEPSRIVIIFHPDSAAAYASIREIARAYKRQFDQQAVLLTYSTASVTFVADR